ncbi:MAG TPA: helix-turn-helix transcriptional regulator [Chryseosolibacter sp.]
MARKFKQYNRIKAALAERQKSSKELADLLEVSAQTVSFWCTNKRQPTVEMLFEIGKVLKVDPRDLLVVD